MVGVLDGLGPDVIGTAGSHRQSHNSSIIFCQSCLSDATMSTKTLWPRRRSGRRVENVVLRIKVGLQYLERCFNFETFDYDYSFRIGAVVSKP